MHSNVQGETGEGTARNSTQYTDNLHYLDGFSCVHGHCVGDTKSEMTERTESRISTVLHQTL